MSDRYDCSDPEQRAAGLKAAVDAVRRGELVVLPTDTVYGIGADAFTPHAITGLLIAKRRGRDMPPPVLVGTVRAATALIEDFSDAARDFIEEFWPGGLTLVCRARSTLSWDLGETRGTVAVRMPLHPVALDLLKETGPLAVSSANVSGMPAATTVDEAEEQLGGSVAVYLDGGPATGGVPSTILDLTGLVPRLLRAGAIPVDRLNGVAPVTTSTPPPAEEDPEFPAAEAAEEETPGDAEAFGSPETATEISDAAPLPPDPGHGG
jgi:tRNA threonylcarbamoyl adenosine modification protein (Sua5/YciO/YrdC/YwlC family)